MSITDYEYDRYEKLFGYKKKWVISRNEYRIEGNTVHVTLTGKSKAEMLCDVDDWEKLKDYPWTRCKSGGYAITNIYVGEKHTIVKFHQVVMGQKKGYLIDHINRNPLDNRKENLRFVTPTENMMNRSIQNSNKSGVSGVSWREDSHSWRATIWVGKKQVSLGSFIDMDDAIKARKEAEKQYYKTLFEDK